MTMKALIQGAGSIAYFGRSTDTIPNGNANDEMLLFDTGKLYTGIGTGTGMASWTLRDNADYMPMMTLALVALSGSYTDLINKPALATVATSGSYTDLSNQPAIPAAQIQSDWSQSNSALLDFIKNKPTIPTLAFGSPNSRSISLGMAYQATTSTKPAVVTVNLSSTAGLTLTAGATNTADIVIGPTNGVAGGTGTVIGRYSNSLTGTLVVGLAVNTAAASPITFALPTGWFWAIRQTSGTITIVSCYDQSLG